MMSADTFLTVEDIARVCHEANRGLCVALGDLAVSWDTAPDWQRASAMHGVTFALVHPHATPENQHDAWIVAKREDGWVYGPEKDARAKTHPCLVPYNTLPTASLRPCGIGGLGRAKGIPQRLPHHHRFTPLCPHRR